MFRDPQRRIAFELVIILDHLVNVIDRFSVRWDPGVFLDRARPGVIGREGQLEVTVGGEQPLYIFYAPEKILSGIQRLGYA